MYSVCCTATRRHANGNFRRWKLGKCASSRPERCQALGREATERPSLYTETEITQHGSAAQGQSHQTSSPPKISHCRP